MSKALKDEVLLGTISEALDAALETSLQKEQGLTPILMLLYCPLCGEQHIDEREEPDLDPALRSATAWDNPPHRSHLCLFCGTVWRPADVPTEGVKAISTKGKSDTWPLASEVLPVDIEGFTVPMHIYLAAMESLRIAVKERDAANAVKGAPLQTAVEAVQAAVKAHTKALESAMDPFLIGCGEALAEENRKVLQAAAELEAAFEALTLLVNGDPE